MDGYGATNEAEFFAVATENFFCKPEQLKNHHPKLYQVLKEFYRQRSGTESFEAVNFLDSSLRS